MRTRRTVAVTAAVSAFMTMAAGCGLVGGSEGAPKASPSPTAPFTKQTVGDEIAALADAAGLPPGDTSTAGMPEGAWQDCVAPWTGDAPAADAARAFEATVKALRGQDWEIVSSHEEQDVTFRTLAKRGWKVFARHYAMEGFGTEQIVSLTAVEDGCELPEAIRGDYEDPA
ncbi:hypothetical protein [Streptomyces sp. NBC_00887]|uniref:hypothetical protein n=1 Tax=Streptomyces sp. NBC_00887 TaxID=2975859 RepID=UPI00386DD171|nr:hypothetical protein OG844_34815 [Streptomyces sp. NBC_00887]